MKIYMISGLGADAKVLERITFPKGVEPKFIRWKIPEKNENFENYVQRMAQEIDSKEPFYLLGYSFGGILVQEIHKIKPAEKIIILGSIKSHLEKSKLMKIIAKVGLMKILPSQIYHENTIYIYSKIRKILDRKNPNILKYFRERNPYYLQWSLGKILEWKSPENKEVIQVLGDKDIVFPIKNSKPDFVIKNGTHLFPVTKHREVSEILRKILSS